VDDSIDVSLGNDQLVMQNLRQRFSIFEGFFCFAQYAGLEPIGARQESSCPFLGLLRFASGFLKFLPHLFHVRKNAIELAA